MTRHGIGAAVRPSAAGVAVAALALAVTAPSGAGSGSAAAPLPAGAADGAMVLAASVVQLPSERVEVPADDWLGALNFYRRSVGVAPAADRPEWSEGLGSHLEYLENTSPSLMTGEYASAHTQNPDSPWYSEEGDAAARSSNLGYGYNELDAIEDWMQAPFHAIGLLRPGLTESAFASNGLRAGLDVLRGLDWRIDESDEPVVFPGDGAANVIDRFTGELPDPTEPCGSAFGDGASGLPLIAMLPAAPSADTTATLTLPSGRVLPEGDGLCVVTADTFTSTDEVYGPSGSRILRGANAVLVMAASPLSAGRHDVTVSSPGQPQVEWSFTQVPRFRDVPIQAHYFTPVRWLAANEITGGVSATRFAPSEGVTRAQMALFMHRMAGAPDAGGTLAFTDVAADAPYAEAVRWLGERQITGGVSATRFAPADGVTRAQMALFLHRMAGTPDSGGALAFADVDADAPYAEAVRWLGDQEITGGVSATRFAPWAPVTRGQMASFLYRFEAAVG